LHVVSTPIGNLSDLSPRAADVLRTADRVLAEDTRRSRILLDHVGSGAPLVSLHGHNEAERLERVLGWLGAGETLALVSDAGTPLVSDPGERLVQAAAAAGHPVVPIPGPSAVLAALVGSGLPAGRFTFLGFPERRGGERARLLARVAASPETVVLFESPRRLDALLRDLAEACGGERAVSVARELTKLHEEHFRGTLSAAAGYYREHPARGEVTVVVAPAPAGREAADTERAEEGRELARALLQAGERPSAVAREVASRLGVPRNLAYRIVQEASNP